MKHYISEKWKDILEFNQLGSSEKLWALDAGWFEKPNRHRGGWSGVSKIELDLPLGGKMGAFLKRQEDYVIRSLRHPLKGQLTYEKECEVLLVFVEKKIPSLELMFFEHWNAQGHRRAVMLTVELTGFMPLSSTEYRSGGTYFKTEVQKQRLFKKLTGLLKVMHKNNFEHNCFYPKHVFAKHLTPNELELKVIDLEKVKKKPRQMAEVRDISTFLRRANFWSNEDKLDFFKVYCNESSLSAPSMSLWKKIQREMAKKSA